MKSILYFLARLSLGIVFVYAGFAKVTEPAENLQAALEVYPVIPEASAGALAHVLPWVELIFGFFMTVGYAPRLSACVLGTLLAAFLAVLGTSRFFFGFSPEDCGCFGQSGIHLSVPQALALDGLSFVIAIQMLRMKEHLWSLDGWLRGRDHE